MKKFLFLMTLIVGFVILNMSCTKNIRARQFGGTTTVELPQNVKLVNVTWKETDLWISTAPMNSTDIPKTYTFYEESSWGIWEGTIYIIEKPYISAINKQTSYLYPKEFLLNKKILKKLRTTTLIC